MSKERSGRYSVLQKIQVECKTCGVSDSFYSNLSVEQFKARHMGHDLVGGAGRAKATRPPELEPAPQAKPLESEAGTRVAKVIVGIEASRELGQPVIRIRGLGDGEGAFSATLAFDQGAKVKEILSKGEFVDYDVTGRRYLWEPEAIEYELDAKEMLSGPAEPMLGPWTAEPEAAPSPEESPLAEPEEGTITSPHETESDQTGQEPLRASISAPLTEQESLEVPSPVTALEQAQERPPADEPIRAPASGPSAPVQAEVKEAVVPSPAEEATQRGEREEDYLLVSKSWYIQGGTGNRKEAVRVSKALRAFRWRVEPVYTIGVILDDMLSIETSRNQISRTLINRVEGLGYRLTAVTTEQGKPVAWFRRRDSELREETGADESELDLEPDLTA